MRGTPAEAKAQRLETLERAPGKGPWRKKMSRRNHFVGTLAVAAGILAAGGMLALMTLVVKVGPAAATPQQIIVNSHNAGAPYNRSPHAGELVSRILHHRRGATSRRVVKILEVVVRLRNERLPVFVS